MTDRLFSKYSLIGDGQLIFWSIFLPIVANSMEDIGILGSRENTKVNDVVSTPQEGPLMSTYQENKIRLLIHVIYSPLPPVRVYPLD